MKLDLISNRADYQDGLNPNDEHYTPIYAIEPIIKYLKPGAKILCPFDNHESNFNIVLREKGFDVTNTHIEMGYDFFNIKVDKARKFDYIISNPPYSLKFEVLSKLFEIGVPFGMLLGVVGLFESQKRFNMFANNDFEIMYLNKRVSYFKDYLEQKPSLNPPFSSVYITHKILPKQIIFENIEKK